MAVNMAVVVCTYTTEVVVAAVLTMFAVATDVVAVFMTMGMICAHRIDGTFHAKE